MTEPRIIAIIQARMGSTRLPGKVLQPVLGQPLLWHLIHRLRKSRLVNAIVIATSTAAADDPLVAFAQQQGVLLVRGSEENVLDRFARAVELTDPDYLIRICGDSPLIDPIAIDRLLAALIEHQGDLCVESAPGPTIHEGFTPVSRKAFDRLLCDAADDPVAREHVTSYLYQSLPDGLKMIPVEFPADECFVGARLSIDTPADVRFIETVYRRLQVPVGEAEIPELVQLLRAEPELLEINCHVHQKKITEATHKLLLRCDGHPQIGLGQVVRCLALAEQLRERRGCGVTFAIDRDDIGAQLVRQAGYPLEIKPEAENEADWLDGVLNKYQPAGLVFDSRTDLAVEQVRGWREQGLLIVGIDDPSERRLAADLLFYPPVPQVEQLNWSNFSGERLVGWPWVILNRNFIARGSRKQGGQPNVLVTMGGSDPAGLTQKAVAALDRLDGAFAVKLVLGSGFMWHEELRQQLAVCRREFTLLQQVEDLSVLMQEADLAIASFGVTAYELAAMGVPSILLALSEDHAASASSLSQAEMAISLGVHQLVRVEDLADQIQGLLSDPQLRQRMSEAGRKQVDFQGAARIAQRLVEELNERHA